MISRIESGGGTGATFATVSKLAEALGMSLDDLAERAALRRGSGERAVDLELAQPLFPLLAALKEKLLELEQPLNVVLATKKAAKRRKG